MSNYEVKVGDLAKLTYSEAEYWYVVSAIEAGVGNDPDRVIVDFTHAIKNDQRYTKPLPYPLFPCVENDGSATTRPWKLCDDCERCNPDFDFSRIVEELDRPADTDSESSLLAHLSISMPNQITISAIGVVDPSETMFFTPTDIPTAEASIDGCINKGVGEIDETKCLQKLYPTKDLDIDSEFGNFVGPWNTTTQLYTLIDGGIHLGDCSTPTDFIHPHTVHTEGVFQYKCEVSDFLVRPEYSQLRIRMSVANSNRETKTRPEYTFHNIYFRDPSDNVVIQYEDLVVKGDGIQNFDIHALKPKINTLDDYDWNRTVPLIHEKTGYYLSFDVTAESFDEAFDPGFSAGFEEHARINDVVAGYESFASGNDYLAFDGAPLSTQDQAIGIGLNPSKNIRIAAIEICNSGGYGPRPENYTPLFLEVKDRGLRLERKILPSYMPLYNFDAGIYPSVSSVWHFRNGDNTNLDTCGANLIVNALRNNYVNDFSTLGSMGPHVDSGKLVLKFSHGPSQVNEITPGAFDCSFDQEICSIWYDPSGAFNTQNRYRLEEDDGFFVVESITLKVTAKKKDEDSRDYALDVVGYSDDGLLNITNAVGGFLQNPPAIDPYVFPSGSGFVGNDDLGISMTSLSEKEQYFIEGANNAGGDHYSLTQSPMVTGLTFEEYEVPLKIYDDNVKLGKSRNYTMSTLFESLYLDIYPLPSGAAISNIHLLVRYAPQNALKLKIEGGIGLLTTVQPGRSEGKLFPTSRQSNDNILNAGSGYNPLSTIENIPHAFTTPSSIKSNYSRRWRGVEGLVQGGFSAGLFGHAYENPPLESPFLSGVYGFDRIEGRYVQSKTLGKQLNPVTEVWEDNYAYGGLSGLATTDLEVHKNIGWRFNSGTLFNNELPGWSGTYKTSDWTSLSKDTSNLREHELYGQIADAFNNVIRISGEPKSINFGQIDTTSGFSIFTRFTPDANISGTTHNFFDSGVLFSKWDTPSDLNFALGYDDGYLCGYAKDKFDNLVTVKDTIRYSGYQYPLSVMLTYNDHDSSGLKLYTDNELYNGEFTYLRAKSPRFYKKETNADLILGYSYGSGVGINMLVSEFGVATYMGGISSGTNIVESDGDINKKYVTAENFFDTHRSKFFEPGDSYDLDSYKLWRYVNQDTYSDWNLGDFNECPFSTAFRKIVTRPQVRDYVSFYLNHDGSGYITRNDLSFPSSINSGVSYHTQIENDFLRFHLSDTSDMFYSTYQRISKDLPRGYNFRERSLVVETIVEHTTSNDIIWHDCGKTIGPKLIVSLYTPKQEPYWNTEEPNWGLVNRDIHYLEPSSCMVKYDSKFTYDSLLDESEEWAMFPVEPRVRDFDDRYFSQDVDDMFVQYDLVYPSGDPFESKIDLHATHVRMDDAKIYSDTSTTGAMNLAFSGNLAIESLNLSLSGINYVDSTYSSDMYPPIQAPDVWRGSGMSLNILGPTGIDSTYSSDMYAPIQDPDVWRGSGMSLSVSGECRRTENLNLLVVGAVKTEVDHMGLPLFEGCGTPLYGDVTIPCPPPITNVGATTVETTYVLLEQYDGVANSDGIVNGDVRPEGVPLEAEWTDPPGMWNLYGVLDSSSSNTTSPGN